MTSKYSPYKLQIILLASIGFFLLSASAQNKSNYDLKHFPKGKTPKEIGSLVAQHFIATPHTNFGYSFPPKWISYPETCTWYGALNFAKATKDNTLALQLTDRFDPFFKKDSTMMPPAIHVDYTVFGAVPLGMYLQTKDQKYLSIGLKYAEKSFTLPTTGVNINAQAKKYHDAGYSWQTRLWVDDMFMITVVQTQAYRATGNKKYIDQAAKEAVLYLDSLQKPNGLFYHAPDVPFFWGRGNGWFAVGMTELLLCLPASHQDRPRILDGYLKMMTSLLQYQTKEGMWNQIIDDANSWAEMSSSGMFGFALITGVKQGWLNKKTYGVAARNSWLGMVNYINENGDTREVCEGTNKKNDRQYYNDRKRNIGDMHGQAVVLWCATALLK